MHWRFAFPEAIEAGRRGAHLGNSSVRRGITVFHQIATLIDAVIRDVPVPFCPAEPRQRKPLREP